MAETTQPVSMATPEPLAERPRISVRDSRDADVPAMLAIYLHHIRRGVDPDLDPRDFEPPNAEDIKRRRKNMQKRKMPHMVAEENGVVLGYAYAVPFRKRPAYRYAIKHSIYVHTNHLQRGVGRALMGALIDACAAAGFRQRRARTVDRGRNVAAAELFRIGKADDEIDIARGRRHVA